MNPRYSPCTLGVVMVCGLSACTLEDAVTLIGDELADCLDEDGCGDASGTPLAEWAPPLLDVRVELGDDDDVNEPRLTVLLFSLDVAPFCPELPSTLVATLNGAPLERTQVEGGPGCPQVLWELGPEQWPTTSEAQSVVEVTDGETTWTRPIPFSLTDPPHWALQGAVFAPGVWARFPHLAPIPSALGADAGLGTPGTDYEPIDVAVTDDELQMRVPESYATGTEQLYLSYFAVQDDPCAGTERCTVVLNAYRQFEVEIAAAR